MPMRILILGGTGAMGKALARLLADRGDEVALTSRQKHRSKRKNVAFLEGNAMDPGFLKTILTGEWDAIVDFMNYSPSDFSGSADYASYSAGTPDSGSDTNGSLHAPRFKALLEATSHYVFLSSARVYAPAPDGSALTEESPRLLDSCPDKDYLATDEYALAKAREEDALFGSDRKNFTVIRPSLTYSEDRLQFALYEKEEWLYRAMLGRSLILPYDMRDVKTAMTAASDVAKGIAGLIGNEAAFGERFNIACPKSQSWGEIFEIYSRVLEEEGIHPRVIYGYDSERIARELGCVYEMKYARAVDRRFSSEKLLDVIGKLDFTDPAEGLAQALRSFLERGARFRPINARIHSYLDRLTHEYTSLGTFDDNSERAKYLIGRYTPYFALKGLQ